VTCSPDYGEKAAIFFTAEAQRREELSVSASLRLPGDHPPAPNGEYEKERKVSRHKYFNAAATLSIVQMFINFE
jgi:hypothetical protein